MQNMAGFESRLMEQLAHTRQEFEDHIRSASGLLLIYLSHCGPQFKKQCGEEIFH